jgi:hypothetical protein
MKTISPVNIWLNGQSVTVTQLQLTCTFDDLTGIANFYYNLGGIEGNLTMSGGSYTEGNTSRWNWAASQLNITIIGG